MEKLAERIVGSGGSVYRRAEQISTHIIAIFEHQIQTCMMIALLRDYLQNWTRVCLPCTKPIVTNMSAELGTGAWP